MSTSLKIAWHSTRVARHKGLPNRLAGDTCRQAPNASNAIVSTSIAWRENPYRQAPRASILYWFCSYHLAVKHHRQALHYYLRSTGFLSTQNKVKSIHSHFIYIFPPLNPC